MYAMWVLGRKLALGPGLSIWTAKSCLFGGRGASAVPVMAAVGWRGGGILTRATGEGEEGDEREEFSNIFVRFIFF